MENMVHQEGEAVLSTAERKIGDLSAIINKG
jgi:hypothetical protein